MNPSSIKLVSIDIETTMRNKREGFHSAIPWCEDNRILCIGVATDDSSNCYAPQAIVGDLTGWLRKDVCTPVIVGHNIKFDLNYLHMREPNLYTLLVTCPIWDTSIAEYILSGQSITYPALRDVVLKRCPDSLGKSDLLSLAIEAGHTTEEIPIAELMEYCKRDAEITLEVAHDQMREAISRDRKLVPLIMMHSNLTKVLCEMECYGMAFDNGQAISELSDAQGEYEGHQLLISSYLESYTSTFVSEALSKVVAQCIHQWINSNQFWSCYLFGGVYNLAWKEQAGVWKSGAKKGLPRYTTKSESITFPRLYEPRDLGSERTKGGDWTVDDKVLARCDKDKAIVELRKMRKIGKIMSTYLSSYPEKTWDGRIHTNIHQTSTHTGRLSQSNPNLQNVANVERLKKCFVPRYDDEGFIEADYKQLELTVFAYIYRDPVLISDLRNGYDVHGIIGRQLYGASYDDAKRRKVKGVVFGMIYGGGSKTLSEQVGLTEEEVRKVINTFYTRYKMIRPVRARMIEGMATRPIIKTAESEAVAKLESHTGREYTIPMTRFIIPTGIKWEPHYTAICNYPIQGLATGDIVPMMLLHIWNRIREESKPLRMINTIHDSILFEAPKRDIENLGLWIKAELEKAPQVFEELFEVPFDLDLPVSVKYTDKSWAGPWKEVVPF